MDGMVDRMDQMIDHLNCKCAITPNGNIFHLYLCKLSPKCQYCGIRTDVGSVIHSYDCPNIIHEVVNTRKRKHDETSDRPAKIRHIID